MIHKMMVFLICLFFVTGLCFLSYRLGQSNAEVKTITKQVEVVKYVEKKRSDIYAVPNANRDELLKRMRAGIL